MPGTSGAQCSKDDYDCKNSDNCGDCVSKRCNFSVGKCYKPGIGGEDCKYDIHCENGYGCNKYNRCTRGNA